MGKMQNTAVGLMFALTAVGLMFALTAVGCSHQAIEAENDAAHPKHAKVKSLNLERAVESYKFRSC